MKYESPNLSRRPLRRCNGSRGRTTSGACLRGGVRAWSRRRNFTVPSRSDSLHRSSEALALRFSGPTGPMAVAMAVIVTTHASSLAEAFTIAIMAGLIQVLLGVLRIGRFVAYTPYSVISGFMSGIGIIIITLQVLPFIGEPAASGGPLAAATTWPNAMSHLDNVNFSAITIAGATLIVGVLWPQPSAALPASYTSRACRRHADGRLLAIWYTGYRRCSNWPAKSSIAGD